MAARQIVMQVISCSPILLAAPQGEWLLPTLSRDQVFHMQQELTKYFGASWILLEDWIVFGPEDGNRVDILFDSHPDHTSVNVRFDTRLEGAEFVFLICKLLQQLDCEFFSVDIGYPIAALPEELMAMIDIIHGKVK